MIAWERLLLAERGPVLRYGVAAALGATSVAIATLLYHLDARGSASVTLATVVLSGIYGGLGPALLDTVMTAAGLAYLGGAVPGELDWLDLLQFLMHAAVGALISDLAASLRTSYRSLRDDYLALDQAKRARENVLGVVSHDLRSPLSVIKLGVDVLGHGARGGRRASDDVTMLRSIDRAASQMTRIIEDLLDAVRIEKGQFRIEPARHEILPMAEDALQSVRLLAEQRGVRLHPRLPEETLAVVCDQGRIVQVLFNLLHNAVKFSPAGAAVELDISRVGEAVRFSVRDHGPGVPEALAARLFERYWQAGTTASKGTGLGLFIARSIVEAHGGRLEIESSPGRGATFFFSLSPASAIGPKIAQ